MSINHSEVRALIEQRARAHAQAVRYLGLPDITPEVRAAFDKAMKDVNTLGTKISAMSTTKFGELRPDEELAFGRFLRHGFNPLSDGEKRTLNRLAWEKRAEVEGTPMTSHVGTYTGTGYFVPTGFMDELEIALKYYCPMLDSATSGLRVINTATGQPLPFPVVDDTTQEASIVGENASVNEQDIAVINHVVLGSYKYTSGVIQVSIESLQDSAFPIESFLSDAMAVRLGRRLENDLTNGNGSNQPTGILTAIEASGAAPVIAAGSSANDGSAATGANSIGSQDLVALEHAVDPAYRRGARYMFHDLTLSALQKLLDKYGRPLWTPGMAENVPDRVNGYPYVINQSMPQIAAGANSVLFGDLSKYVVRSVKNFEVQRLNELYAVSGMVGFIGFARLDANFVHAQQSSSVAIAILEQHS